jgi:serine/threonine-protein kinase HipA
MDRTLHAYIDLSGTPHLVGTLWARTNKSRESATFEYAKAWLDNPLRFELEPALALGKGPQHTLEGRKLFGAFGDSAPDRWGRKLILRDEQRRARAQKRDPKTLNEVDYLVRVSDFTRQGALRFAETQDGEFLAPSSGREIPPLVFLPKLLAAAMHVGTKRESDDDIKLLLAPGSSLGGARPKASVIDKSGALSIAKFPQSDDATPVPVWEAIALELAACAGIDTPSWQLQTIAKRPVVILRRFDRNGEQRIPYLSAMSMLGASDGEQRSYMEIADALRQHGAKAAEDCAQLWRRVVFNILISNTDDHLRNHGFLYEEKGWRLAPAFDLNPVPVTVKARNLSTAINEADTTASLEIAFEVASHFGVKKEKAREIAGEVGHAVQKWRALAKRRGLSASDIDEMATAFEHDDLKRSLAMA